VGPDVGGVDINRYAYANNDPINLSDANGHFAPLIIAGEILIEAGVEAYIAYREVQAASAVINLASAAAITMNSSKPAGPNGNTIYRDKDLTDQEWADVEQRVKGYLRVPGTITKSQAYEYAKQDARYAASSLQATRLKQFYSEYERQLKEYDEAGSRKLSNGRYRFYGDIQKANKDGEMKGRRRVREWDPETGRTRTWHETVDGNGRVRRLRPQSGPSKTHFNFNKNGDYINKD
jgi:hypothetical protein